jgi:integrase
MIEAVLLQCDDEERLLIAFIMETGARINEAMRFSSEHISSGQIVLYTRKSKNANLTGRKVPVPFCLIGLTFEGRLFKRWTNQPRFLEKKIRKLKLPMFGFHSLRHRYASRLSAKGKPLYEIMELLGHNSLTTTQIYLQSFF